MARAVAKKTEGALALDNSLAQYAGAGTESAQADDKALPLISILQGLSPQVDPSKPGYMEDAKPGMFFNNVTRALTRELVVYHCYFKKVVIEWKPRESGGGLVAMYEWAEGSHLLESATHDENTGRLFLDNGNNVADTRQHYCMCIDKESGELFPAVIPMVSTQVKRSRRWLSALDMQTITVNGKAAKAPSWLYGYNCRTVPEANAKGSWFSWEITKGDIIESQDLFDTCVGLYESVRRGEVYASDPHVVEEGGD